ncbi:uncharacterized protein LOC127105903 [Lathyrus oleraceus]|uniref:DUF674 family protein n=1 Tax=Pisum sativum TaxID=3888 RepID=A0A9D5A2P5_PEA|nr:uncharacterized protein LOC127105903 [Pisum sativum]KAI5391973.1 hypothetical protein KIW84_076680 [Pisum sativum]
MASEQPQEDTRTISLKVLVEKQRNKVVLVEATKDFVDTLFSFLSLPLGTIIRLLSNNDQQQSSVSESSSFLGNINNLYRSVQNLNSEDVWNNPVCQQMLLHPRNPCEALCMKLFLNVDDTEPSNKILVCDHCNRFTTFQNLVCICGKPTNKHPKNLDSEGQTQGNSTIADSKNGVFVKENGSNFTVSLFDDLKIVPSSIMNALHLLNELGYSDLTQLEEITHKFGKQEILNLLKYCLTSHEPLTNTILKRSSKNKDNLSCQFSSAQSVMSCSSNNSKIDIKVVQSKSQKKVVFAEANGDFVNFILSFLTMPLGSIIKLLGPNYFDGCVTNLYKSVENLDSSLCTCSHTVLLNPGVAPQFGFPKQLLNIPHAEHPLYYYGTGTSKQVYDSFTHCYENVEAKIKGGVFSKKPESIFNGRTLTALDPRSPNRSKVVGFVKKEALYGVGDDLTVKALSADFCLSYFKESSIPLDDLEVKVISIGEVEAMNILGASLISKFTLTNGLGDFLKESTVTSN